SSVTLVWSPIYDSPSFYQHKMGKAKENKAKESTSGHGNVTGEKRSTPAGIRSNQSNKSGTVENKCERNGGKNSIN
ncbi:MAG: hypothetical protein ACL7AX_13655, partial [Candidatus Arsenophonus phytopathogenicus]